MIGVPLIMVILLAVLALVVVKALKQKPVGDLHGDDDDPDRRLHGGFYALHSPGPHRRVSLIGFVLLIGWLILIGGRRGHESADAPAAVHLLRQRADVMLIAMVLSPPRRRCGCCWPPRLPVHIPENRHHRRPGHRHPFVAPELKMPAFTKFANGGGPFSRAASSRSSSSRLPAASVSGFHALVASGTTPKLLESEVNIRFIGYGAMLVESFVAIMALVAAS